MLVVVARVAELRRDHVQRDAIFQNDSRVAVACTVQRDRRDACGHHEPPPRPTLQNKTSSKRSTSPSPRQRRLGEGRRRAGMVEVAFAVGFLSWAIFHG